MRRFLIWLFTIQRRLRESARSRDGSFLIDQSAMPRRRRWRRGKEKRGFVMVGFMHAIIPILNLTELGCRPSSSKL